MTYTGSIYFLGAYRPAYFEADTSSDLARAMFAAVRDLADPALRLWLENRIVLGEAEIGRIHCGAWSADHCNRGVSMAKRSHDPFLDRVTRDMPACPGLDYSRTVNCPQEVAP